MGCCASGGDFTTNADGTIVTGTRFPVKNLDDQNRVVGEGFIEITETDLVLYSGTPEPVRWPLRYLRRYGFDQNLFSFEAGRRCPTGEGIYVFSTKHQEKIFKLVENNIRHGPKATSEQPEDRPDRVHEMPRGNGINGRRPTETDMPSPTSTVAPDDGYHGDDAPVRAGKPANLNYVRVDLDGVPPSAQAWPIRKAKTTAYAQLDLDKMKSTDKDGGAGKRVKQPNQQLNYVELEFRGSVSSTTVPSTAGRTRYADVQVQPHPPSSSSQSGSIGDGSPAKGPTPSSPADPIPYSRIDFEKTKAVTTTSLRPPSGRQD